MQRSLEVMNLEKNDPTDLDELMNWATSTVFFGGLAAIVIIGAVGLAFCILSSTPAGMA